MNFPSIIDLAELSTLPNYAILNIIKGINLYVVIANPTYYNYRGYIRSYIYNVITAYDNLYLYQRVLDIRHSSYD